MGKTLNRYFPKRHINVQYAQEKMLITSHQENVNRNHNEVNTLHLTH